MTTPKRQPPSDAADREALFEQKIEQLEAELADTKSQHLRLAADFDNYKKRTRQEQSDTFQNASVAVLERVLPAIDDLQRVLEHVPEGTDEVWERGLRLAVQKLEELLVAQGLTPIDSIGTDFDPKLHEAIGHEETADQAEDTVVTELRRGYMQGERVVRPALVRIARAPESPAG